MKFLVVFIAVLVVAYAQEFVPTSYTFDNLPEGAEFEETGPIITEEDLDRITHPRFRRGVSMDPNTGDVTADHKTGNGRVFGTLGSTDTGLFWLDIMASLRLMESEREAQVAVTTGK